MNTSMGIKNLPTPSVERVTVTDLVIPDQANEFQRQKVGKKVKELIGLIEAGYKLLPIMVARIAGQKMVVIDGGQRTRSYQAAGVKGCDAIVFDFRREDEDLLTRVFMATDNSAKIASNHIVWTWPGPIGKIIQESRLAVENRINTGKGSNRRPFSASILARGLLTSVVGGTSGEGCQKTLQALDELLATHPTATARKLEQFFQVLQITFPGTNRVELSAMLAVAQVFNEKKTMPGKRIGKVDWTKDFAGVGRSFKFLTIWREYVEARW